MGLLDDIGSTPMERSRGCSVWHFCAVLGLVVCVIIFAVGSFGNQFDDPRLPVSSPRDAAVSLGTVSEESKQLDALLGDLRTVKPRQAASEAAVRTAGAKLEYYKRNAEQRNEGYRTVESREGETQRRSRPPPRQSPAQPLQPTLTQFDKKEAKKEEQRRRQPAAGRIQVKSKPIPLVVDGREYERTLWEASRLGVLAVVRQILAGASASSEQSVNAQDDIGNTALHYAANEGKLEVAKELINKGANVNAKGSGNDWTPLHSAVYGAHKDLVKLLLDKKADPNAVTTTQWTAMHSAASEGQVPIISLLLDAGANINAANFSGKTPIYLAAAGEHTSAVKFLLEKGADPMLETPEGGTASDAAMGAGAMDLAKFITSWVTEMKQRET